VTITNDLSAILDRAARSGAIDPREANNINIQLAKDAQEAMPAMPMLKAQDAANKLSKQFGVNFDVSNHPTAYGNRPTFLAVFLALVARMFALALRPQRL
jgi:hypothetical protein